MKVAEEMKLVLHLTTPSEQFVDRHAQVFLYLLAIFEGVSDFACQRESGFH